MSEATRLDFTPSQKRAIETEDPRHVVSAGAGSGKTAVIVERIVRLAKDRDAARGPGRLLAITFTEKGAAELKHRLIRAFEMEGMVKERREAEAAYISTIHGFCARILREWPMEARTDPGFAIQDRIQEALFFDERLEDLFGDQEFARLANEYGTPFDAEEPTLFAILRKIVDKWREHGRTVDALRDAADFGALEAHGHRELAAYLNRRWTRMMGLLAGADQITTPSYLGGKSGEKYERLCSFLSSLSPQEPRWDLAQDLWECIGFYTRVKKPEKEEWRTRLEPARDIASDFRAFDLDQARRLETDSARRKARVLGWAADLWEAHTAYKEERNLLDYQDLQLRALRLLRDHPPALSFYRRLFSDILLDEAQDTNPIQYEILKALRTETTRWFLVGDPKQAIYGFRNADLALFVGEIESAGPAVTKLAENFRSRAEILDLVNAVGHAFWAADPDLDFFELNPGFPYPPPAPGPEGAATRVELGLVEQGEADPEGGAGKEPLADARAREARWVARRLLELESSGEEVVDGRTGRRRPFSWRDAAVLLRTRAFEPFQRAFQDADIPHATAGSGGFFDGLEVRDLLNGLAVIANPMDDVALLAALRSPLCGISDDALVRLRMVSDDENLEGFWPALARASLKDGDAARVARFHEAVEALRRMKTGMTPPELLDSLLDATGYPARLMAGAGGDARVANLRRLQTYAREHEGVSLEGFLVEARRAARYLQDEVDAVAAEPDADMVRLSTIHGAKGLEWPVVFLSDLSRPFWHAAEHSGVTADGGLMMSVARDPMEGRKVWQRPFSALPVQEDLDRASAGEAQRLLYVGMTRARERLVLSGVTTMGERLDEDLLRPVSWLRGRLALEALPDKPVVVGWSDARVRVERVEPDWAPGSPARSEGARHASTLRRGQENDASGLSPELPPVGLPSGPGGAVSVTRLAGFLRCPLIFRYAELGLPEFGGLRSDQEPDMEGQGEADPIWSDDALPDGTSAPAGGRPLGDAVHAALEKADFRAEPGAEALRLCPGEGQVALQARGMVRNVLESPLAEEIRASATVRREVPFFLPLSPEFPENLPGGRDAPPPILHGIIDLMFRGRSGGWVLIDWKTNAIHDQKRLAVLLSHHTPQVQLYAAALDRIAPTSGVEEGRLLYLARNLVRDGVQAVDVSKEAREETWSRAVEAARRIWEGDYSTQAGPKCGTCGYRRFGWCDVGLGWGE